MAAQRLGISDRQCRRFLSRYRESGPLGMANRRRGKPNNNQLPDVSQEKNAFFCQLQVHQKPPPEKVAFYFRLLEAVVPLLKKLNF